MADADVEVVLAFHDAINARDIDRLVALMSPDHRFVDTAGTVVDGLESCRAAWTSFFASFPDYRNIVADVRVVAPGHVVSDGRSDCAFEPLSGPARWHARIDGGSVAEWRVEDPEPDGRSGPDG